jgi:glucan biosynthesis protein C
MPVTDAPQALAGERPERMHHLDWLRVVALGGVFLFHALHPFDTFDWHVKNTERSEAISILLAFLFPWGLGFFFLIAGAASLFALRRRSPGRYVRERLSRLFVPYVVGWLLLAPVQSYIEDVHNDSWEGSWGRFIPHFVARAWREATVMDEGLLPLPLGWSYHLWFLVFLLWFSLLALPLFLFLRTARGERLMARVAPFADRRGSCLLFALPIALAHVAVRAASPDEHAWGEFAYYFGFFVAGYVLMTQPRLMEAVRRDLWPSLAVGVVGFVALLASGVIEWAEEWSRAPGYSWRYAAMFGLFSVQAWAWAVAALSLGLRVRAFARPLPYWAGLGAMPFFVLHQPVILAVAFVVVGTALGLALKVLLVVFFALVGTAALTALATANGVTRLMLGAKSSPEPPAYSTRPASAGPANIGYRAPSPGER